MTKVQKNIKAGISKDFIRAICNHDNELVLEYLKNGRSATKEAQGEQPIFYAINNGNFEAILLLIQHGAKLEKDHLEGKEGSNQEALKFLASLIRS